MGFTNSNGRRGLVSEINVTPLVDVMLVLLIIFMVTAPMMSQGVDVELPETTAQPLRQKDSPIIITINKDGEIFIDRIKASQTLLEQKMIDLAKDSKDRPVFLNADKRVAYGLVVKVMADIKQAGFDKLGMITQPDYKKAK
ncbi:MAG: protein TolR [Proteobacteria bacterium]|nr:protein TolR [Pseudomonadota bacterium]MBU1715912.1 protein TolR [Pseudomonadota bacterium]